MAPGGSPGSTQAPLEGGDDVQDTHPLLIIGHYLRAQKKANQDPLRRGLKGTASAHTRGPIPRMPTFMKGVTASAHTRGPPLIQRNTASENDSSPHTRSTPINKRRQLSGLRFIPAGRGTLRGVDLRWADLRFIPVCTGNTSFAVRIRPANTVHPRVRGEHGMRWARRCMPNGSSPRARGTRSTVEASMSLLRFIPACAGNTSRSARPWSTRPVHPRVRGEHEARVGPVVFEGGSSPRARGTHELAASCPGPERFIPACAGNTARTCPGRRLPPVHPRVRGEHDPSRRMAGA